MGIRKYWDLFFCWARLSSLNFNNFSSSKAYLSIIVLPIYLLQGIYYRGYIIAIASLYFPLIFGVH